MSKDKFKTEEEANAELIKLQNHFRKGFCVVFRSTCKGGDCHSFDKGRIGKRDNIFWVCSPYCRSPLITGFIEHQEG